MGETDHFREWPDDAAPPPAGAEPGHAQAPKPSTRRTVSAHEGIWPEAKEWGEVAAELPKAFGRVVVWPELALRDLHEAGRGARVRGIVWILLTAVLLPLATTLLSPASWGGLPQHMVGLALAGAGMAGLSLLLRRSEGGSASPPNAEDDFYLVGGAMLPYLLAGALGLLLRITGLPVIRHLGEALPAAGLILGALCLACGLRDVAGLSEKAALRQTVLMVLAGALVTRIIWW